MTIKHENELKGCPFCGMRPVVSELFGKLVIRCNTSGCIQPDTFLHLETTDLKIAAKMWNTRNLVQP